MSEAAAGADTGPGPALDALESHAKSARGRAALNALRSELVGEEGSASKRGRPSTEGAKSEALKRFSKQ